MSKNNKTFVGWASRPPRICNLNARQLNSILDDLELAELWQALQGEAPDGGLWNGTKVADCLSKGKGEPVHRQRGWEIGVAQ